MHLEIRKNTSCHGDADAIDTIIRHFVVEEKDKVVLVLHQS